MDSETLDEGQAVAEVLGTVSGVLSASIEMLDTPGVVVDYVKECIHLLENIVRHLEKDGTNDQV